MNTASARLESVLLSTRYSARLPVQEFPSLSNIQVVTLALFLLVKKGENFAYPHCCCLLYNYTAATASVTVTAP